MSLKSLFVCCFLLFLNSTLQHGWANGLEHRSLRFSHHHHDQVRPSENGCRQGVTQRPQQEENRQLLIKCKKEWWRRSSQLTANQRESGRGEDSEEGERGRRGRDGRTHPVSKGHTHVAPQRGPWQLWSSVGGKWQLPGHHSQGKSEYLPCE